MNRCWLAGAIGDALRIVSCAAGYNLRWLLRAIARGRIKPPFYGVLAELLADAGRSFRAATGVPDVGEMNFAGRESTSLTLADLDSRLNL